MQGSLEAIPASLRCATGPFAKCANVQAIAPGIRLVEPAVGFHQLRHTYASLLAQAGADLLTISKLLGHADTRITSRHYAHLCDKTLANAVNRFLPNFGVSPADNVTSLKNKSIF